MRNFFLITILPLVFTVFGESTHPDSGRSTQVSYERVYLLLPREGNIAVIDPFNGVLKRRIQVGTRPEYIQYDAARRRAYVSNTGSNIISIVDVVKEVTTKIIHMPFEEPGISVGVLAFNPVKNHLYVAEYPNEYSTSANIWVVDVTTDDIVTHFGAGTRIVSMSTTADGKKLLALNEGKSIGVYDTDTFQSLKSISPMESEQTKTSGRKTTKSRKGSRTKSKTPPPSLKRLVCNPGNNLVYVTYGTANRIQVLDGETFTTKSIITIPDLYRGEQEEIFASPDGASIFIVNHKTELSTTNSVLILDTKKNEIVKLLDTGFVRNGVAVSQNGKFLYTAGSGFKNFDLSTFALTRSVNFLTELGGMVMIAD